MNLLEATQLSALPSIDEGDAGVILKKDGTFMLFNTHRGLDADNMTERQIEQGKQLLGIAAALRIPAVMQMLVDVANDPKVFSQIIEVPTQQ